jgi:fructoselysine 6-kinase
MGREQTCEAPAANTTVVDTLGAGDTFIATVLTKLLEAANPREALAKASEASARTCSRLGAFGEGASLTAVPLPAG